MECEAVSYTHLVRVVSSYPGTPSTEITESATQYNEMYVEWSSNEKVGVEVAIGAEMCIRDRC